MRADYLLKAHQKLIDDGFLPESIFVGIEESEYKCCVCGYPDLKGVVEWRNRKTDAIRYTGLTCFERVKDRLNLTDAQKKLMTWATRNPKLFKGRGFISLKVVEIERLLSLKRPLSAAYGNEWERVSRMIWADRARFPMNDWQLDFLGTFIHKRGKFWTDNSPTPRQRRFLNELLVRYLEWKYQRV